MKSDVKHIKKVSEKPVHNVVLSGEDIKQTDVNITMPCSFRYCDKTFLNQTIYNRHISRTHKPKTFVCSECQICFKEKSKQMKHMFVHKGKTQNKII